MKTVQNFGIILEKSIYDIHGPAEKPDDFEVKIK
jgi:hypothetical protein